MPMVTYRTTTKTVVSDYLWSALLSRSFKPSSKLELMARVISEGSTDISWNDSRNPWKSTINPYPTAPFSCSYPLLHTSFSSPIFRESPPTSSARPASFPQMPPQPYPQKTDCTQTSRPTLPGSTYSDHRFSVVLFLQSPFLLDGTSFHKVCACGRLAVNICQVGRRGSRAGGTERGGSVVGHWVGGRPEEYGRAMGRTMED